MIIVSQDKKTIINFDNISEIIVNNNEIVITDDIYKEYAETIGEYATEERAKEVLKSLVASYQANKIVETTIDITTQNQMVDKLLKSGVELFKYEMPKE